MRNKYSLNVFKYHYPKFLLKDLHKTSETENEKIVIHVNHALIHLRNAINKK